MIYYSDNKYKFYLHKVQFTSSTDGAQSAYCNNVQDYIEMLKSYPWQFSNLVSTTLEPTAEQQSRLELLNTIEAPNKNTYEGECVLFVEHGAILDSTQSQFLLNIKDNYLTETSRYFNKLKNDKWNEIKIYRSNLTLNGGYKVSNDWFHSDTFSRSQQLGLVMMGNNIPQGLMWKTMQGTFAEMTPALAQAIFQAAAAQDSALFSHAESLNAQVQALATAEEVQAFDITQGWPETYSA